MNGGGPVVASEQLFTPWGEVRAGGINQTSHTYTGQRLDGSGLLYYHARYYDPALTRFVSADSVVPGAANGSMDGVALKPLTVDFHEPQFTITLREENRQQFWFQMNDDQRQQASYQWGPLNPQALNRYSYVQNRPINATDPSGHWERSIRLDATKKDIIGQTELDRYTKGLNDRYNEFWITGGTTAGIAWIEPPLGALLTLYVSAVLLETNRMLGVLQNAKDFLANHKGGMLISPSMEMGGSK